MGLNIWTYLIYHSAYSKEETFSKVFSSSETFASVSLLLIVDNYIEFSIPPPSLSQGLTSTYKITVHNIWLYSCIFEQHSVVWLRIWNYYIYRYACSIEGTSIQDFLEMFWIDTDIIHTAYWKKERIDINSFVFNSQ